MSEERVAKLEFLLKTLRENGGKMKFVDMYGAFVSKGTTKRTLMEYLKQLRAARKIDYPQIFVYNDNLMIRLVEEKPK